MDIKFVIMTVLFLVVLSCLVFEFFDFEGVILWAGALSLSFFVYSSVFTISKDISIQDTFVDENGSNRYIMVTILTPTKSEYRKMKDLVYSFENVSDYEVVKEITKLNKGVKIYIGSMPNSLLEMKE